MNSESTVSIAGEQDHVKCPGCGGANIIFWMQGGFHYVAGEVYDDIYEYCYCKDCKSIFKIGGRNEVYE